jgi:hypothetical protein
MSLAVHPNMVEQANGQRDSKPKRHNAKFCPDTIRQRIINALANGDSMRAIARAQHVSNNTVVAIREQNWQQVASRKTRIAAQAELNATLAADRITNELQSKRQIPLNVLVPVFGVNVDKAVALRGDSALTISHEHTHTLSISGDDLIAFAVHRAKQQREKQARAKVIAETHQLAEKTQSKKSG